MLDKILKISTIISSLIVANGIIYLSIYFHYFDINIFSYLEFSEILTAFVDSLDDILIFFLIYLIHAAITFGLTIKRFKTIESQETDPEKSDERIDEIGQNFKSRKILIFLVIIIAVSFCLIYFELIELNKWVLYILSFLSFNIIGIIAMRFSDLIEELFDEKIYELLSFISMVLLPFVGYTIIIAHFNAFEQIANKAHVELIRKNNDILKIPKDYYFIGKTSKYIFLFNPNINSSLSISLQDVEKITSTK